MGSTRIPRLHRNIPIGPSGTPPKILLHKYHDTEYESILNNRRMYVGINAIYLPLLYSCTFVELNKRLVLSYGRMGFPLFFHLNLFKDNIPVTLQ